MIARAFRRLAPSGHRTTAAATRTTFFFRRFVFPARRINMISFGLYNNNAFIHIHECILFVFFFFVFCRISRGFRYLLFIYFFYPRHTAPTRHEAVKRISTHNRLLLYILHHVIKTRRINSLIVRTRIRCI